MPNQQHQAPLVAVHALLTMARLSPPPAFQEFPPGTSSSSHLLIDFSENTPQAPGGENPPPDFTPYNAEYFLSNGNVISHDPHLNTDGKF